MHKQFLLVGESECQLDLHLVFENTIFHLVAVRVDDWNPVLALVINFAHFEHICFVSYQFLLIFVYLHLVVLEEVMEPAYGESCLVFQDNIIFGEQLEVR